MTDYEDYAEIPFLWKDFILSRQLGIYSLILYDFEVFSIGIAV